jgi:hypothetical protein
MYYYEPRTLARGLTRLQVHSTQEAWSSPRSPPVPKYSCSGSSDFYRMSIPPLAQSDVNKRSLCRYALPVRTVGAQWPSTHGRAIGPRSTCSLSSYSGLFAALIVSNVAIDPFFWRLASHESAAIPFPVPRRKCGASHRLRHRTEGGYTDLRCVRRAPERRSRWSGGSSSAVVRT